ncbi:hypothetical protein [Paenibacillus mucilaginosus]|uniref:HPP family protein n=2 Tax=Paenibacillus mucilaginosus TaxID=61624 RepID=H6NIR3_9BACL|nr:hypothetical protein [Paenibacillus mucilaginosus]AEI45418.1 hypothetical protein KNP414_06906 [Paenibacillus mucilaginosus KNP414]AFC33130.1 hypothetical protein PM3016_6505 [Paenibacillus mucilaginosus 3016]MCG7215182.1 hypothetical protein [Paenibacillus mucilaginosus]WDM26853.1 hypothetical protein KCX80_31330 [Paenibacillus mucilaginosus]WFA21563.1 hypothetical protein ERY13_32355 [Paenibacillus mucilaginosus]
MDHVKTITISLYLFVIYYISVHIPALKPLFYPTLGAFSYLFVSRAFAVKDLLKLIAGATTASLLGSCFYFSHAGGVAFLCTSLVTIWMIRKFHLNAPPILAVALIPYFAQPAQWWTAPVSVVSSLTGLVLLLLLMETAAAGASGAIKKLRRGGTPAPEQFNEGA